VPTADNFWNLHFGSAQITQLSTRRPDKGIELCRKVVHTARAAAHKACVRV